MVFEASAVTAFTLFLSLAALAVCLRAHNAVSRTTRLTAAAHGHFILSQFFTLIALFALSLSFFMGLVANDFVFFYGLQALGLVLLALATWRFAGALLAPAVEEATDSRSVRAAHAEILRKRTMRAEKDFDRLLGMARDKALVLFEAGRGAGVPLIASYLLNRLAYSASSPFLAALATSAHPAAFRKSFPLLAPKANLWVSEEKIGEEELAALFQSAPPSNQALLRKFFESVCAAGLPVAFVGDWTVEPADRLSYDAFHELIHSLMTLTREKGSVLFVTLKPESIPGDKLGILRRYADVIVSVGRAKGVLRVAARDQATGREEKLRLTLDKLLLP
ncbi:MAG: hypothetical protein QXH27_02575 [Candidatus Micrarchaeia archaeon]